jgi:hypothetical protein
MTHTSKLLTLSQKILSKKFLHFSTSEMGFYQTNSDEEGPGSSESLALSLIPATVWGGLGLWGTQLELLLLGGFSACAGHKHECQSLF